MVASPDLARNVAGDEVRGGAATVDGGKDATACYSSGERARREQQSSRSALRGLDGAGGARDLVRGSNGGRRSTAAVAFAHGLEGEQEGEGGEAELTVRLRKALDGLGAVVVREVTGEHRR